MPVSEQPLASATPVRPMAQRQVGKYQILRRLGSGGMGVVYQAYDPDIDRNVAIKTIHKHLLEGEFGKDLLERFRHEVRAVGRLSHPNIVAIYDYGEDHGVPYFVMECVEGQELRQCLKEGARFTFAKVIDIISQVLDALAYTHSLDIIHRDIKPANIILLANGQVKITDFGIARLESSELTQTGGVIGTPNYMSPEQCMGFPVDKRSDLFSTGILLYELLTGTKAFPGEMSNTVIHNIITAMPVRPNTSSRQISRFFDVVLKKALAKRPEDRFQTAEKFKEALQAFAGVKQPSQVPRWFWPTVAVCGLGYAAVFTAILQFPAGTKPDDSDAAAVAPTEQYEAGSTQEAQIDTVTQEKIEHLLAVAEAHELVGRLISPPGSNAYDAYQLVLQLAPGHSAAVTGLERIANEVASQISQLRRENRAQEARDYVELGLKDFPDHPGLLAHQSELNASATRGNSSNLVNRAPAGSE